MSAPEREIASGVLRLHVRPAPSDDEAAAIVAALRLLGRDRQTPAAPAESIWRQAARREGLRGDLDHGSSRWLLMSRLDR